MRKRDLHADRLRDGKILSWDDTGTTLTGSTNNTVVTITGANAIQGEANLTFDGSQLAAPDGSASAPSVTNTGDLNTGIYFPAADQVGVVVGGEEKVRFGSTPFTGHNLLINGDMKVAQRGTITGQGASAAEYAACDRVKMMRSADGGSRVTTSRDTAVGGAGEFDYSLKVDCTTVDATVAATHGLALAFTVEAQDLQHLRYGNAAALAMNLSFWFRSPKTGIHTVSIFQEDANRAYVREFTIASADTFEFFSVTFPGDTSGTINNDTGPGLAIVFPLTWGSDYEVAADGWRATGGTPSTTDEQQNLLDNTANNIYITGVQLEVGEVATAFEHRGVGEELARCKRYFERHQPTTANAKFPCSGITGSTYGQGPFIYDVEKRAVPTITMSAGATFNWLEGDGTSQNCASVSAAHIDTKTFQFQTGTLTSAAVGGGYLLRDGSDTTFVEISAEL
jgi:hypothetical protein